MKLKENVLLQSIDDTLFLVPAGNEKFRGIGRSNASCGFILKMLKEETTPEEILDALCRKYDAPRQTMEEDLQELLDTLRKIDVLEE
ncbi:MAG: PqqD family protein [Blautia sp.]|nr:PqqD family protein [Blautia sp.]